MAYEIISQNNTTTTLSDGTNTIVVPGKVVLATSSTYEITGVNNNTATLEGSDGSVIRDVPCVAVLYGGGSSDTHNKGYFATQAALEEAYPTAEPGDWAIVGETDTVWVWDEDNSHWVDTDTKGEVTPDMVIIKSTTMPTASTVPAGAVYQYVGTTNATYTHGYIYENIESPASYDGVIGFDPSMIGFDYQNYTLAAFFGSFASNYNEIVGGSFTYDLTTDTWAVGCVYSDHRVASSTFTTAQLQSAGFVLLNPSADYTDGLVLNYNLTWTETHTYSWQRIDVQPNVDPLPSQAGNSGKFLTTDGTDASWATVDALPSQTGYSGRVLGTDGFVAGWVKPEIVQRSTMPVASQDEEGNVYQFVGTTDSSYTHGYFYECVSDGGNPATYSWVQTNVQPTPSGLPSQSGNSGKFLTTDGTDASWSDKPLVNNSTLGSSLSIIGTGTTKSGSINIGYGTSVSGTNSVVMGYQASGADGCVAIGKSSYATTYATAIGEGAKAQNANSIAIGSGAMASGSYAIQFSGGGYFTNNEPNTFKVAVSSSLNCKILDYDGTIPTDRYTTTPVADGTYVPTLTISSGVATRSWAAPGGGGSVPTLTWYSVSTAGNTLTIADTSSAQLVKIYKNGLLLQPTEDYTISGTTLTTVAALVVGDKITTEVF